MKIDSDLKKMSSTQLRREVMKLRTAFRKELKHTGNHRCWINLMQPLPEFGKIQPLSLPRGKFLGNCAQYFDRNQPISARK